MRVRTMLVCGRQITFGNMYMPNTTEVHLAALDSEKAILAEIKHDDKLEDKSIVHIQVALLYTSLSAQRRVRVMNLALSASAEFPEVYRCAEIDVIMNFMMKNSLKGVVEISPADIREGLAHYENVDGIPETRQFLSACQTVGFAGDIANASDLRKLFITERHLLTNRNRCMNR